MITPSEGRNPVPKSLRPLPDATCEGHNEDMKQLSDSAGSVGLAMGMFFLIVGVVVDSIGVAALGLIVMLTGLYARSNQP